jgi:hypothetical protein
MLIRKDYRSGYLDIHGRLYKFWIEMKAKRSSSISLVLLLSLLLCKAVVFSSNTATKYSSVTVDSLRTRILESFQRSTIDAYETHCKGNKIDPEKDNEMSDADKENNLNLISKYQRKAVDTFWQLVRQGTWRNRLGFDPLARQLSKNMGESVASIILALIILAGLVVALACGIFNFFADLIEGTSKHKKYDKPTRRTVERNKESLRSSLLWTTAVGFVALAVGIVMVVFMGISIHKAKYMNCANAAMFQATIKGDKEFVGLDGLKFLRGQYLALMRKLNSATNQVFIEAQTLPTTTGAQGNTISTSITNMQNSVFYSYAGRDSSVAILSPGIGAITKNSFSGPLYTEATNLAAICKGISSARSSLGRIYTTDDIKDATLNFNAVAAEIETGLYTVVERAYSVGVDPQWIGMLTRNTMYAFIFLASILCTLVFICTFPILHWVYRSFDLYPAPLPTHQRVMTTEGEALHSLAQPPAAVNVQLSTIHQSQGVQEQPSTIQQSRAPQAQPSTNIQQPVIIPHPEEPNTIPIVVHDFDDPDRMDPDFVADGMPKLSDRHHAVGGVPKHNYRPRHLGGEEARKLYDQENMFIDGEEFKEKERKARLAEEFPESFSGSKDVNSIQQSPVHQQGGRVQPNFVSIPEIKDEEEPQKPSLIVPVETGTGKQVLKPAKPVKPKAPAKPNYDNYPAEPIHYTKKVLSMPQLRVCYRLIMIFWFITAFIGYLYTTFSLGSGVFYGFMCRAYNGIRNSPKGYSKSRIDPLGSYDSSYITIFDSCLAKGATFDYLKQDLSTTNVNLINGIYGIGLLQKSPEIIDNTPPKESEAVLASVTSLANFDKPDTDGNAKDLNSAINDVNKNSCAQDKMAYKGQCPSGFTLSQQTDAVKAQLGTNYCVHIPDVSRNPDATKPYFGRYTGESSACSGVSLVEGEKTLVAASRMAIAYTTKVANLQANANNLNNAEKVCQNLVTPAVKQIASNIYNNEITKPYIDMQLEFQGNADMISSCRYLRIHADRVATATCYKYYKYYYLQGIMAFVFSVLVTVLGLFMLWGTKTIDNVWELSDNPPEW